MFSKVVSNTDVWLDNIQESQPVYNNTNNDGHRFNIRDVNGDKHNPIILYNNDDIINIYNNTSTTVILPKIHNSIVGKSYEIIIRNNTNTASTVKIKTEENKARDKIYYKVQSGCSEHQGISHSLDLVGKYNNRYKFKNNGYDWFVD